MYKYLQLHYTFVCCFQLLQIHEIVLFYGYVLQQLPFPRFCHLLKKRINTEEDIPTYTLFSRYNSFV